jgi:hypothetical protein
VRRFGAGFVDQAVIASANAGMTLLSAALLPRARSGALLLAIGVAYLVLAINRAFVGEVLLVLAARHDDARRDRLSRDGLATAVTVGVVAAAGFVAVWALTSRGGAVDLHDLIWIAPLMPAVLLHDTGRYSYLAQRRPDRALVVDLVWVGTQAVVVVLSVLVFGPTAGGLLVAWGLGAAAGATVFGLRTRTPFWRGNPRRWLTQTRQLSGWFTATALIGQVQTQAVGFLVTGYLSPAALSGLRTAQTSLLQPVQNVVQAIQVLLAPRLSRLAGAADSGSDPTAARQLRRQVRLAAVALAGLATVTVGVAWPLARAILLRIPKFADIAPLALPITLQAAIYLIQVPFAAALRGMHRGRLLFGQYVAFTTVSLTGLIIGAHTGSVLRATWGLTTGSAVGVLVMIGFYRYALRRLPIRGGGLAGTAGGAGLTGTAGGAGLTGEEQQPDHPVGPAE